MVKEGVGAARQASSMPPRSSATGVTSKASAKSRTSDRLEEDAQAMEARLVQLRLKMLEDKQKLEKDLPAKFGGARWRSAQETIGSVSRYAKDVEDRMVKKPSGKSTAKVDTGDVKPAKKNKNKKTLENGRAKVVPSIASIKKWTTHHVLEWLTSLALDEFHSAFEFHQVTGSMLLEMQADEFASIGVTRLSARNLLRQELERIKESLATAASRYGSGSLEAAEVIDSKIIDVPLVPEVSSPGKRGVHWSHVQPLRDPNTTAPQAEVPVNLADGEFDEDGGHASFMNALLDWRAGDGDVDTGQGQPDDGMWVNPLMASNNHHEPASSGGGALLEGEYDEAKEQDAFRRAVLAWRRAGAPDTETTSRPSTAEIEVGRIEQGCATDQRKSCWQCYRVVREDLLVRDAASNRTFCGKNCEAAFEQEHARLYAKKED